MESKKQIDYLTGLKGLACIGVSVNHFAGIYMCKYNFKNRWFCSFYNGTFMVYLFIFLSCFFVAYSWFKYHDIEKIKKNIFTRYFRLAIPLMVVMFFISLLMRMNVYKYYDFVKEICGTQRKDVDAMNYYTAYGMSDVLKTAFSCLFSPSTKFTFVIWMLPVLFTAYMETILISLSIDRLKPVFKVIFLILAWFVVSKLQGYMMAMGVVAVGLGYYYGDSILDCFACKKTRSIMTGGGGLIFVSFIASYWPNSKPNWYHVFFKINGQYGFWYDIGIVLLMFGIMNLNVVKRILELKPIMFFGKISFGFYIWHDVVQASLSTAVFYATYIVWKSQKLSILFAGISFFVATTLFAMGFRKYIDIPVQKILDCLYSKITVENIGETIKIGGSIKNE